MRIPTVVHLIESRGPGGAESVLNDLAWRVDPARFRSRAVIKTAESWLGRALPTGSFTVVAPSAASRLMPFDLRYALALRRALREEGADIVHAHSFDTAVYASLAALGLRTRVMATFHGASDVQRRGAANGLKWRLLRRADATVMVSASLLRLGGEAGGVRLERASVIHNGVDLTRFAPQRQGALRAQLQVPAGTLLFGAVGNVRAPKGYDVLLRAVALCRARGVPLQVAIAGDDVGPLADRLRALRAELGLAEAVHFMGFTDDAPAFLNGVDCFVLPSLSEGFSLSTVQALATALPAVATRSGGPEEIIEAGVSGLLVAPGSPEALADGISQLAGDRELRERLSGVARARATAAFSTDAMVERYTALYDRLLGA